jgi:hypothetical protein
MFDVSGTCIENPIFAEPLNTDFRICMMGKDASLKDMMTLVTALHQLECDFYVQITTTRR